MDRWVGKVAVVTGASNNIGSAITVDLVKAGMIVIGLARRKELVEDLRKFIPIHTNGKLYAVKCDVSNELDVARAFGWIFAEVGVVNVLVNCEEMKLNSTITTEGNEDELKSVLQTNLWSAVLCTKKAVEIMKRQRITDAHIININSADGHKIPATKLDKPLMNMYPVSKFGLTALTEILRREFRFDRVGYKITVSLKYLFMVLIVYNNNGLITEYQSQPGCR